MDISDWQVLILIGIFLATIEIFVPSLVFLPIGIGVLVSSIFAYFIDSRTVLYFVVAICVAISFLLFKKLFKNTHTKSTPTAVDGMVGKQVVVIQRISGTDAGAVKLYGDTWTAFSFDKNTSYETGEKVYIRKVEGNHVHVSLSSEEAEK